jgi:chromatin assembly factor 1 subunit B
MNRTLSHDGSDSLPTTGSGNGGGVPKPKNADGGKPTVYIYSRANLSKAPVAHLPGHRTASVAIKFSPIFYDLRSSTSTNEPKQVTLDRNAPGPVHVSLSMPPPPPPKDNEKKDDKGLGAIFALPYRLLYAVACQDAVLLYDTQQSGPIAIFKGLHYAGFTDVAWYVLLSHLSNLLVHFLHSFPPSLLSSLAEHLESRGQVLRS